MAQPYGQGQPAAPYPAQSGFGFSNGPPPPVGGYNSPNQPGYNPGGFNASAPAGGYGQAQPFPIIPGQSQWTTNAAGAPQSPNPPAAGGDIGFNFKGPSLPGYIDSSFDPIIQPPTNPYFSDDGQGDGKDHEAKPLLPTCEAASAEEAKAALDAYVGKKCCYGPATGIEIQDITMKSGFKYKLSSHSEQRETVWEFEPYVNQRIEGPTGQPIPGPWDVVMHPSNRFMKETKEMQIPGTASIRQCHTCVGNGKTRCTSCEGFGGKNCTFCNGRGNNTSGEACTSCNGQGRSRCNFCSGNGMQNCKTCKGNRQLYVFLKLIVKWNLIYDEFVSDASSIPKSKLSKKCKGIEVVNEQGVRVQQITNFPDQAINSTSQSLIQKQLQAVMPNGAIREQKQSVELIRIAEVNYAWKGKNGTFHMYGVDNYIYFPDYPNSCYCCCGNCTIC